MSSFTRCCRNMQHPEGIKTCENTPAPLGESLLKEMPEVELAVTTNAYVDWYSGEGVLNL